MQSRVPTSTISIHAPRMGSDVCLPRLYTLQIIFLSTPPAWGATIAVRVAPVHDDISIHAPRMGSDDFASTTPVIGGISIHAPRMGSDFHPCGLCQQPVYFYPRPPHGERLRNCVLRWDCRYFYPRPPHGERPRCISGDGRLEHISIHAPRMGSDTIGTPARHMVDDFYPRPPHGERQRTARKSYIPGKFLSTPPAWGATANMAKKVPCLRLFVVQSEKTPEQFPKITRPFSEIRFPLHKIKQKLMYSAVRTSRQNNVRSRFALQP